MKIEDVVSDSEIIEELEALLKIGHVEIAGKNENGEDIFVLTPKGREYAEAILKTKTH